MRILIVSTFFPPMNAIASHRPYSWAKYWAKEGHKITVLTQEENAYEKFPLSLDCANFHLLRIPEIKILSLLRKKKNDSSHSLEKHTPPNARSFLSQTVTRLVDATGSFSSCRMPALADLWILPALKAIENSKKKWDFVVSTAGPYSVHILADKIKSKGFARHWVADYRDLWCDNHNFRGIFPLTLIERFIEKRLIKRADAITTVSRLLGKILEEKYLLPNVHIIENGYDPSDWKSLKKERIFPDDGKIRIVYTGTLYKKTESLSPLFSSLIELNETREYKKPLEKLEILIAGHEKIGLNEMIEEWKVSRWVRYIGQVGREDSLRMQRDADYLLFLGSQDKTSAAGVLTGKLFEYLHAETNIFALGIEEHYEPGQLIIKARAGELVAKNKQSVKTFLIKCLHKKNEENKRNQDILQSYQRETLAKKFLNEILYKSLS